MEYQIMLTTIIAFAAVLTVLITILGIVFNWLLFPVKETQTKLEKNQEKLEKNQEKMEIELKDLKENVSDLKTDVAAIKQAVLSK